MRNVSLCHGTWLGGFIATMSVLVLVPWGHLLWKALFRRGKVMRHYSCAKERFKE